MDSINTAINKAIHTFIVEYTNTLHSNGVLTCSIDEAISMYKDGSDVKPKKKKTKPDVIKSLPMWTTHHFDTCIALVGDCMAQCSLNKTHGQFCTACSKKCGDDGIPPNGTIFTRTSYDYVAPNGKTPKPFIESTIYKKKIKDGESPSEIKQYYDDLHFDISPFNWMNSKNKSTDNKSSDTKSSDTKSKCNKASEEDIVEDNEEDEEYVESIKEKPKESKLNKENPKEKTKEPKEKTKEKPKYNLIEDDELKIELPDGAYEWSYGEFDYLAVDFPNGDKNIFDVVSHEHIGIYNAKSKRLIRY